MIQITYTLVKTSEDAKKIAKTLIEEKLAACVNIAPGFLSLYVWQDQIQESSEIGLIIKSSTQNSSQLIQRLKEIHPYELPAIAHFSVSTTFEYESWINQNKD